MIDIPSVVLIAAPPGSGKSHLIRWILREKCLAGEFNHGLVITSTKNFSEDYDFLPSSWVKSEYRDSLIEKFIQIQEDNPESQAFLVLDDVIGKATLKSKTFLNLITCFRHYRITILIAVQYINNHICATIKTCARYGIWFQHGDENSLKCIFQAFGSYFRNFAEFREFCNNNLDEKYSFIIHDRMDKDEPYKLLKCSKMKKFVLYDETQRDLDE